MVGGNSTPPHDLKAATAPIASSRTWLSLLIIVPLTGLYVAVPRLLDAGIVDDSYIFLRYARNFADGYGLVFNPGERVEGYTSPLWQFCLGMLAWLHVDLVAACTLLSAVFGLATMLLLLYAGRGWVSPGRYLLLIIPCLFLVTSPAFQYWAWSGMDTLNFTFFFFATFVIFLREVTGKRTLYWSGICFTLGALGRLDILALLPVYICAIFLFNKGQGELPLGKLVSFLLPMSLLALHFLWRYSYYDSWLPNTFYAKVGVPFTNLLQKGLTSGLEFVQSHLLYVLACPMALLLAARLRREFVGRVGFALIIVVTWAGYVTAVGGDHFAMYRFFAPVLPILALLFVAAVDLAIDHFRLVQAGRVAAAAVLIGVVVVVSNYAIYERFGGVKAREEVALARRWTGVGLWLKQNVPPQSTIASMVVGAIPYYSELKTFDLLGLTDKEVARGGKVYLDAVVGHQKYNTDYILEQRPDYIVFASSGVYTEPSDPLVRDMNKRYYYSVYDLANDLRTQEMYEFKAVPLADGTYVEFLQRK
ncbi:MAG TPA: hypothetical protein VEX13_01030 [Chloroflexia bacterium]|nr:hypothetical protein [Chloroflexia bacterium]